MENKDIYFNFLEELRQSGITNMYGATAFLTGERLPEDYGYEFETQINFLDHTEAVKVLSEWMKNYLELSKRLGWDKSATPSEDNTLENEIDSYSKLFDNSISKDTVNSFLKQLADEDLMGELNDAAHIWQFNDSTFIVSYNSGDIKFLVPGDSIRVYEDVDDWADDFGYKLDQVIDQIKALTNLDLELDSDENVEIDDSELVYDYETGDVIKEDVDDVDPDFNIIGDDEHKPTKLKVIYDTYERYGSSQRKKEIYEGDTLLDALKEMVDNMGLYLDSEIIEEDNMLPEDIIESISWSNGDGCDFIILLKNLTTGEILIEEDDPDDYGF